jgi:hypothetical protein
MTKIKRVVTKLDSNKLPLPDALRQFVLITAKLQDNHLVDEIATRFRINRSSGYQGIDVFFFLVAYFCAIKTYESLNRFGRKSARWGLLLASTVGRAAWPTQGAISRALAALVPENIKLFCDWLLQESIDDRDLSLHESATTLDCEGQAWHVFHFDPRVTTLRKRALPEDEHGELCEPSRRSEDFAAPGYPGRKRGDIQIARSMLQHSGTGLWLMARVAEGNGDLELDLHDGLFGLTSWAHQRGVDPARCLMCIDGVARGIVQVKVCSQYDVRFITRLSCYEIFNSSEVQQRLNETCWERVEDSGSGPVRWATDLGRYRFADGSEARLIVTRFASDEGRKSGAGHLINGVQYEIFATNLEPSAWPAPEVVTEYYGRVAQENRYAQCDDELNLSRIFSYNLAGQLLAETVALWLWNFQTCAASKMLGGLLDSRRPRQLRTVKSKVFADAFISSCPEFDEQACQSMMEANVAQMAAKETVDALMEQRLSSLASWSWDRDFARPRCPSGILLQLHGLKSIDTNRSRLIFRNSKWACGDCPLRVSCTSSTASTFRKEVSTTLALDLATLSDVLRLGEHAPVETELLARHLFLSDTAPAPPGTHRRLPPSLIPSVLRRLFREACDQSVPTISIHCPTDPQRNPDHFAPTDAERQKRRRTWSQRQAWNAVPPDATIDVTIAVTPEVEPWITRWIA